MNTAAALCLNHPDRDAIGVCIECRSRVCGECVTKVDGINHCVTCYGERADLDAVSDHRVAQTGVGRRWLGIAQASLMFSTLTFLYWVLLTLGLDGG